MNTLEQQLKMEEFIKSSGKWFAYSKRIAFLYKLMRAGTIDEAEYLKQHERSTIAFAAGCAVWEAA